MKMPQHPPNFNELLENFRKNPSQLLDLMKSTSSPTVGDKYLHWDELRYLKAPGDLSSEEWWLGLKLIRMGTLKTLPLVDKHGKPFQFSLPDPVPELLHFVDQNGGGKIEFSGADMATDGQRDRYLIHSLIEEAITSSQLEGAAITRLVAKQMIRSGRMPRNAGEQMIANNYKAMEYIRLVKDHPLDEELLLTLHRILTDKTLDPPEAAGRYRRPDEEIRVEDIYNEVLHSPPPAQELSDRMAELIRFANGQTPGYFIHPVIRSILLHFWLAYDHPFVDGNGRCARALFYWSMLRQGAWLCEFISISQVIKKASAQYGRAFLHTETDDNDLTYFILYHLEVIKKAFTELQLYIARKLTTTRETERLIRGSAELNHRQIALLSHALRHPDAAYSVLSHRNSHNVVTQTARSDLESLVAKGLLLSRKKGAAKFYYPVADLEDRLKNPS